MMPVRLSLSPRDRRALVAGAVVMALLIAAGRGWPAWNAWRVTVGSAAERAQADAVRKGELARLGRAIDDTLVARRARLNELAQASLPGDGPPAGGAALAALVSESARASGVSVGALDISSDSAGRSALVRVRVHASVSGDINGIALLLTRIEGAPAHLIVRALAVQAADLGTAPNGPEALQADLLVEGVWRRPAWMPHP